MSADQRRGWTRRAVLQVMTGTMGMAALGLSGMAGLISTARASTAGRGVCDLYGTVTIGGRPATLGQQIGVGEPVVTGVDSRIIFVLGEDAFLQRSDSEFVVENRQDRIVLRYLRGQMLSVFGTGRKMLMTPTASISLLGTACYIEAKAASTYFCLREGSAVVIPNADANKRKMIRTRHHDYPLRIEARRGPSLVTPARMMGHDDTELTMLEGLLGRPSSRLSWPVKG